VRLKEAPKTIRTVFAKMIRVLRGSGMGLAIGGKDGEGSPRSEYTCSLGDEAGIVGHVLNGILRDHRVEGCVAKR
jgi:hypothetical protein